MVTHPYHKDSSIFFALVALFIMGTIGFFMWIVLRAERQISTYAECVQSKSSKILESYPQICMSAGGKRFVQPLSDEELEKTLPPPSPIEQSEEFKTASTSARTYTSSGQEFSFMLPAGWIVTQVETNAQFDRVIAKALDVSKADETKPYPIGRIHLDYRTLDSNFQMSAWRNNFIPAGVPFGPTKISFGGVEFETVESSESGGFTEASNTDSYFGTTGKVALGIFVHYQDPIENAHQKEILSTFQFTP